MKKIITAIAITALSLNMSLTAHAADMLDKDYVEAEIWEDMWLGKGDNGTDYPEASFKHHLLDKWIEDNYGSEDLNWTNLGVLKYEYRDYYDDYIEDWDFNDDENGRWTISTDEHYYHFQLVDNIWNMIDENGDTVDTFPPFSTLVEETEEAPVINGNSPNNDGNNPNVVVGIVTSKEATTEPVTEEAQNESSGSSAIPLVIGGAAIAGVGAAFLFLRKRK